MTDTLSENGNTTPSRSLSSTMEQFNTEEEYARSQSLGLAPMDKGIKAWTFVACAFVVEAIVFGFSYSFGVFQEFYLKTAPFNQASESMINSIGTTCNAIQYILLPFIITFVQRKPQWVRPIEWSSLVLSASAMIISSFTKNVILLVLLQGVGVGLGGALLYAPIIASVNEWFVERRSLATAIIFGGSGVGGAVFPVLIDFLLSRVGFAWTLRILGIIVAVCGGTALLGATPRLPVAPVSNPHAASLATTSVLVTFSFVRKPIFASLALTIMAQALAYFPVSLYIPAYASSIGLSTSKGTIALAVFNITGVVGQILFGYVCDRTAYTHVMFVSALGSALTSYLLWGWAHNIGLLFAFVIIFGTMSTGFSSTTSPAAKDILGPGPQSALFAGCLGIFKGIAVIIGPLISASLRHGTISHNSEPYNDSLSGGYAGYGFTGVTIFVGTMMAVATGGSLMTTWLRAKANTVAAHVH